jgi:hypothetical protein
VVLAQSQRIAFGALPVDPSCLLWDSNASTTFTPDFSQRAGGTDSFFQTDWLGSTRYVTDSSGATTAAQSYEAFGHRDAQTPGSPNHPTDMQWAGGWRPIMRTLSPGHPVSGSASTNQGRLSNNCQRQPSASSTSIFGARPVGRWRSSHWRSSRRMAAGT